MNTFIKKLLFITLVSLVINTLNAANYYVRLDGNDTNTGLVNTAGGAWLTIVKANNTALPGDTIYLGPGTFPGDPELLTVRSGTALAKITWIGSGKDITSIRGFNFKHSYITVKDLTLTGPNRIWESFVTIEDCILRYSYYSQIFFQDGNNYATPNNIIIRNCESQDASDLANGQPAMRITGTNNLIENITFTTTIGGADVFHIFGYNNIIRGCKIYNWFLRSGSTNHVDIYQTFSNNGEFSIGHLIENNFAYNCTTTQLGNITDLRNPNVNIRDWVFRNNIYIRVDRGINLYCPGFLFYNNTFFETPLTQTSCVRVIASTDRGSANNTKMFNNIFYKGGVSPSSVNNGYFMIEPKVGFPITGFEADYNLVIGTGAGTVKSGVWASYGANVNSLNGIDPLFVQPINPSEPEHLRLLNTSPAIGTAIPRNDLFTTDFSNVTRGVGWDIGAYEYAAGSVPSDIEAPDLNSATINSQGNQLTLSFNESVVLVNSSHYSISGLTLGTATGSGTTFNIPITPAVGAGQSVSLNYTAGTTEDPAGNNLLSFTNFSVQNNSIIITPTNAKRKGLQTTARP